MKNRRKIAALALIGTAILFLISCGKEAESDMQKVHLGVAYYDQRDTFLNEMIAEMKVRMKEYETEDLEMMMSIREAAGIQKTQNDQVKELLDAGCNVLCVNLVDRADPSEIIDLAREREVPIIFFNREPPDNRVFCRANWRQNGFRWIKISTGTKTERSSMWFWRGKQVIRMRSSVQKMRWKP